MALKLGNEVYKDGEQVDYYSLNGYLHSRFDTIKLDLENIKAVSPEKFIGTLQFNPGGWISKSGWILKDSKGKFQYDFNTEVNTLNDKPFDRKKSNILLLKKAPIQAKVVTQAPVKTLSLGDDDYLNHQKVEYLTTEGEEFKNGDVLTFTQSWNSHRVKTQGTLRKRDDQWIIEYYDRGYKIAILDDYLKLQKIPTYVPPPRPPPRVLTEEEIVAKATQEANAKEQQEIARQAEIEKKETEAQEDRVAETVYDKIPCSAQRVNVGDRVLYNDKLATVTDVLYEITYEDKDKEREVVKCDGALFNVSYAIKQNKDNLYTQRNPRSYGVNERWGGTRRKRKNRKNRKTRYGLETRS